MIKIGKKLTPVMRTNGSGGFYVKCVLDTLSDEFSTEVKLSGSADENALLFLQTLANKVSFAVCPRFKLKRILNKQGALQSNEFFSVLFG